MISKIAKYPVEAELGRGGFGVVYRAYDPDVGRPVAIKVLTAESDSDLFKRFQDEVGTTGNLTHTNIVVVFESGNESGVPYLVMELLSGRTLQAIIKQAEPMPLLDKVRIMTQVAEGLKYAHQRNVIHRDVKPGNVMVRADGQVKIMDFGIARVTTRSTVVTREGYIIGTIPYMAPEQFQTGGRADKQTDIFAYGAMYYEFLTGKHPFENDGNIYGTIERIKMAEPDSIMSVIPECPEALELLIYRAMAKDREVRYASFEELLLDSDEILSDLVQERAAAILDEVPSLIEAGEIEAAENKLGEVAALEPGNREARRYRKVVQDEKERRKVATRLPALLEESDAHLTARRFGEAVQILETALRLTRNDATVKTRLAKAQARVDAQQKASKLLSEARRDQQKGQIGEALKRLQTALDLDPDHPDVRALFTRLETEQARRQKEGQLQQVIAAASEHLTNKRYDEALAVLHESGLEHARIADLRTRIDRARGEATAREQIDRFNLAVSNIREALRGHELTKASDLLDRLPGDFPGASGSAQLVEELRGQLDAQTRAEAIAAYSQQARDLIRQKWLPEALNLLEEATERFPEDSGLKRLRESAAAFVAVQERSQKMAAALKEANALRDGGDLPQALASIAQARRQIGEDRAFDDLERQFQLEHQQHAYATGLEELLHQVRALIKEARYGEAIRAIEAAHEYEGESEVRSALASAKTARAMQEEQELVDSTLPAVAELEQQKQFDRAAGVLREARQKYPYNRALSQAADRIGESLSKQQRQAAIAAHRSRIEQALAKADWKSAQTAIERAQREVPEEPLFEEFAARVRRAEFDAGLDEAASLVRGKLAANAIPEAVEQLNVTRTVYSGDPRWKQLEQEVAQRKAYEAALRQADQERQRSEFGKAEELLTGLVRQGSFDDRVTQMLAEVQDRRVSEEMHAAHQAIDRGDFDRGLTMMEMLRVRATPEWTTRIDNARRDALDQQKQALDRERQQRDRALAIEALRSQAHDLSTRGEFAHALAVVAEGLKEFPDAEPLVRLQESLLAQARAAALAQARGLQREGKLDAALQAVRTALRDAPGDRELLGLKGEIEAGIEQERRRKQRELELELANRATRLLDQEDPQGAVKLLKKAPSLVSQSPDLQELLKTAETAHAARQGREAVKGIVAEAQAHLSRAGYQSALDAIDRGLQRFPQDAALQSIRAEAVAAQTASQREDYRAKAIAEIKSLVKKREYDRAAGALAEALRKLPDDSRLLPLSGEIEEDRRAWEAIQTERKIQEALSRSGTLMAEDPAQSVALLERFSAQYPDRRELTTQLAQARVALRQAEESKLIREAERLCDQNKFAEAAAQLNHAGRETAELLAARQQVEARRVAAENNYIAGVIRSARETGRQNPAKALLEVEKLGREFTRRPEIDQLVEELRAAVRVGDVKSAIAEIQSLCAKGKLAKARTLHQETVARLGADPGLDEALARIEAATAVKAPPVKEIPVQAIPKVAPRQELVQEPPQAKSTRTLAIAGLGAIVLLGGGIWFLTHRSAAPVAALIPVEIRTDPPGASVQVNERSCVTPNCRFDLPPGSYTVQAQLKGYVPAQKALIVDAATHTGSLDLTLQPLPPAPSGVAETGTLVVKAGFPDVLVFVDDAPSGRTDASGALSLVVDAKTHTVRVEKTGYETPREQQVRISRNASKSIAFTLAPQAAKLELRGAPAGVEVRSGGAVIGRTDGTPFSVPVAPGDQVLKFTEGSASREVPQRFEPGRIVTLDWSNVAPPKTATPVPTTPPPPAVVPPTAPPPTAVTPAANPAERDWTPVSSASDPAQVQSYIDKYPNGPHTAEAKSRLDTLAWSRVNQNDLESLRAYANRFPGGAHSRDALSRIADLGWNNLDKSNPDALRAYVEQNPDSPHRSQAQSALEQFEKQKLDAADRLKQERAKVDDSKKALDGERPKVLAALERFNSAFAQHSQKEVKAIWPTAPKTYLDAVTTSGILLSLEAPQAVTIAGTQATLVCNVVARGPQSRPPQPVKVTLQNRGNNWVILTVEANR